MTTVVVMSPEELDARIEAAVRKALAPSKTEPEALFMKVVDFAKRIDVSERHVWDLVKRGLPTIGTGRSKRIEVKAALDWMRGQKAQVDDSIERDARRAARRAASRGAT